MRAVLTVIAVALALAPAAPAAPRISGPANVDPRIADGSAARALQRARQRWQRAAITSYSFDAALNCFCTPRDPSHVVVERGRPNKAAAAVPAVATVPRMFALVAKAISSRYAGLTVRYGRYGVPLSISLNPVARIVDEESSYTIEHFKRR